MRPVKSDTPPVDSIYREVTSGERLYVVARVYKPYPHGGVFVASVLFRDDDGVEYNFRWSDVLDTLEPEKRQ